jgi:hypothetical protein
MSDETAAEALGALVAHEHERLAQLMAVVIRKVLAAAFAR